MEVAVEDLRYWARTDSKKYQRIKTLLEQLCTNPQVSIGKPEPLKGDKVGLWSCRIDKQSRFCLRLANALPLWGFAIKSVEEISKHRVTSWVRYNAKRSIAI
jgi:Txe/YoeB family toxin of toxin-antitoxin system